MSNLKETIIFTHDHELEMNLSILVTSVFSKGSVFAKGTKINKAEIDSEMEVGPTYKLSSVISLSKGSLIKAGSILSVTKSGIRSMISTNYVIVGVKIENTAKFVNELNPALIQNYSSSSEYSSEILELEADFSKRIVEVFRSDSSYNDDLDFIVVCADTNEKGNNSIHKQRKILNQFMSIEKNNVKLLNSLKEELNKILMRFQILSANTSTIPVLEAIEGHGFTKDFEESLTRKIVAKESWIASNSITELNKILSQLEKNIAKSETRLEHDFIDHDKYENILSSFKTSISERKDQLDIINERVVGNQEEQDQILKTMVEEGEQDTILIMSMIGESNSSDQSNEQQVLKNIVMKKAESVLKPKGEQKSEQVKFIRKGLSKLLKRVDPNSDDLMNAQMDEDEQIERIEKFIDNQDDKLNVVKRIIQIESEKNKAVDSKIEEYFDNDEISEEDIIIAHKERIGIIRELVELQVSFGEKNEQFKLSVSELEELESIKKTTVQRISDLEKSIHELEVSKEFLVKSVKSQTAVQSLNDDVESSISNLEDLIIESDEETESLRNKLRTYQESLKLIETKLSELKLFTENQASELQKLSDEHSKMKDEVESFNRDISDLNDLKRFKCTTLEFNMLKDLLNEVSTNHENLRKLSNSLNEENEDLNTKLFEFTESHVKLLAILNRKDHTSDDNLRQYLSDNGIERVENYSIEMFKDILADQVKQIKHVKLQMNENEIAKNKAELDLSSALTEMERLKSIIQNMETIAEEEKQEETRELFSRLKEYQVRQQQLTSNLSNANIKVTELEEKIKKSSAEHVDIVENQYVDKNTISDQETKIADLEKALERTTDIMEQLKTVSQSLNTENEHLYKEMEILSANNKKLSSEVSATTVDKVNQLAAENENMESSLIVLNKFVSDMCSITGVSYESNNCLSEISKYVSEMQGNKNEVEHIIVETREKDDEILASMKLDSETKIFTLNQEMKVLENDNKRLRTALAGSSTDETLNKYNELLSSFFETERKNADDKLQMTNMLNELNDLIERFKDENESLKREISELNAKYSESENEYLEKLREKQLQYDAVMEEKYTIEQAKRMLQSKYDEIISKTSVSIRDTEVDNEVDISVELDTCVNRNRVLEEKVENIQREKKTVENNLKASRTDIENLQSDLKSLTKDAEKMSNYIKNNCNNDKIEIIKAYNIMSKLASAIQRVFDLDVEREKLVEDFRTGKINECGYKLKIKSLKKEQEAIRSEIINIGINYECLFK